MLRHHCPSARGALACALVALVVFAAPAAAIASGPDALRAARATERYWSTYDIDNTLPRPAHQSPAASDPGPTWEGTIALAGAVALVSAAAGAFAVHAARRPRGARA
jgi:hypothetical protein